MKKNTYKYLYLVCIYECLPKERYYVNATINFSNKTTVNKLLATLRAETFARTKNREIMVKKLPRI